MKSLVVTAAAAVLLAAPALSFAQSAKSPVTRAQVLQELIDLESVGYNPARGESVNYPDDILAAQERLAAKRLAERKAGAAAYGPAGAAGAESGAVAKPAL
ncbi:hypothetical protein WT26_28065 [Burkholderia cepacia]|uniref:DUF4148 domain-containing protein n=1 Tax=Burkholderia cepacia TaxID=292 RepID=A0A1B4Q0L5_BURCE|nr:DUF4148 domain-containing protein [Burkholderia cepacia]AOK19718.1 hypothetical protein WT26_28065 [Burkholderia cepacia]